MAEHDLMRVAEMISGLGLIANNETDEIAIELDRAVEAGRPFS
jgi:hypothetical protein